jgi:triacylglycerol esterase/lipase EstA (alpha/beta hydrolase family)
LENDGITASAVEFSLDDACGSAEEHASELNQIVEDFKAETGAERINIVAHSKGGLDARVYLANNLSNKDIANLIMIGTPNAGSPLANLNDFCRPAIYMISGLDH